MTCFAVSASAQQPGPAGPADADADDALLDECARAVIELRHRKAEVALLTEQMAALREVIAAHEQRAKVLEGIVSDLERANAARRDADTKTDAIEESFKRSLELAAERIRALEAEVKELRSSRRVWAVLGVGAGFALRAATEPR